ncbi:hypothetical protein DXG01_012129 [Tephrocybe rancida]|nr:hypothetical protein DXG01_012129 [Tephrocybe rancida]
MESSQAETLDAEDSHQNALHYHQVQSQVPPVAIAAPLTIENHDIVEDAVRHLLASLAGQDASPYPLTQTKPEETAPDLGIHWNLFEATKDTQLAPSAEQQGVALVAQGLLEQLDAMDLPSDNETSEERLDFESETETIAEPCVTVDKGDHSSNDLDPHSRKRACTDNSTANDRHWAPWPDKISCTLDILMHLPRSVFSQRQLDLFLWLLQLNNVDNVPKIKAMQAINESLQKLSDAQDLYQHLPHPSIIHNVFNPLTSTVTDWTFTDPHAGNPWRAKAHEHSLKEYNIHFLSTSNIAPPLEMLDGIVEQLEQAQEDRIWAWDAELGEPVLMIPQILVLLGDNPMQSEFACHIGLRGKLFCCACWVKGTNTLEEIGETAQAGDRGQDESDQESTGAVSDAGSVVDSEQGDIMGTPSSGQAPTRGRKKKLIETMSQMVSRVKSFLKIGQLRTKDETTEKLRLYFSEASVLDMKTKVKSMRTESGIKDTYQLHFIEQLFNSYKSKRGRSTKQAALDAKLTNLPKNTMSAMWRIKGNHSFQLYTSGLPLLIGLDPHQDTPFEILHVILLGFVKYLWRDLVQLQLKTKDDKKTLLATHLVSFDVLGLGISPLAGPTLVQYSGSITGRDFRVITQAALFVVYDLVSKDCLKTWVAHLSGNLK